MTRGAARKDQERTGYSILIRRRMEIICIDKKTFDEFWIRFCELESRLARLCRSGKDMGLKNWMDNQDVCDVLHISKKTLQVYRDKGLLPFTRIKHKMFYKPEDVQNLLESSYHPLKRKP